MKRHNEANGEVVWFDEMKCFVKREITNIKQNLRSSSIPLIFIISAVLPQYNVNNNKNGALLLPEPPAFNTCTFCNKLESVKKSNPP